MLSIMDLEGKMAHQLPESLHVLPCNLTHDLSDLLELRDTLFLILGLLELSNKLLLYCI